MFIVWGKKLSVLQFLPHLEEKFDVYEWYLVSGTCLPLRDTRGALRVVLGEAAAMPQAVISSRDRGGWRGGRGWLTVLMCAGRGGGAGTVWTLRGGDVNTNQKLSIFTESIQRDQNVLLKECQANWEKWTDTMCFLLSDLITFSLSVLTGDVVEAHLSLQCNVVSIRLCSVII